MRSKLLFTTILTILLYFQVGSFVFGQDFYRFSADISIKSKQPDGKLMLVMGKVYYDKNLEKTVYQMRFPYPEVWVQEDSTLYKIVSDTVQSTGNISLFEGSNLYKIMLDQQLGEFGLDDSFLELKKVIENNGVVLSTYTVKPPADQFISSVMMESDAGKLRNISVYDKAGELVMVQKFSGYHSVRGLQLPAEIMRVMEANGTRQTELIKLSNVVVNDLENDNFYNYTVPVK